MPSRRLPLAAAAALAAATLAAAAGSPRRPAALNPSSPPPSPPPPSPPPEAVGVAAPTDLLKFPLTPRYPTRHAECKPKTGQVQANAQLVARLLGNKGKLPMQPHKCEAYGWAPP